METVQTKEILQKKMCSEKRCKKIYNPGVVGLCCFQLGDSYS